MELIQTVTLTSTTANITFTSLPQDGTDLLLEFSLRTNRTGLTFDFQNFYLNGSGSSYITCRLFGDRGSVVTNTPTYLNPLASDADDTTNNFSTGQIYIPNYTGSQNKSFSANMVLANNSSTQYTVIASATWTNSAAITELQIAGAGGSFVAGSTASLYKITKFA